MSFCFDQALEMINAEQLILIPSLSRALPKLIITEDAFPFLEGGDREHATTANVRLFNNNCAFNAFVGIIMIPPPCEKEKSTIAAGATYALSSAQKHASSAIDRDVAGDTGCVSKHGYGGYDNGCENLGTSWGNNQALVVFPENVILVWYDRAIGLLYGQKGRNATQSDLPTKSRYRLCSSLQRLCIPMENALSMYVDTSALGTLRYSKSKSIWKEGT